MFSVLILTLNEERNLPRCLASARASDDIVVFDSGSTDGTVALARAAGARAFTHPFRDFAQQRNQAHADVPFRHPWVFHLDADEELTPELIAECTAFRGDENFDGAWVAPRMMFMNRWIRRSTDFPAWQARFVKPQQFRFVQVGHGQREAPEMRMTYLHQNYVHDLSREGEAAWLAKHRRYAIAEAAEIAAHRRPVEWTNLFDRDPLRRRRALKAAAHRAPGRPWLRFLYQYLWRGGCLDGSPGWRYCRLLARYEGFIVSELRRRRP